ncbi:hypothetical protein [Demequina activiva]|uniref:hypothetical protein n=1 Tax=Demequina activiva TaxID=1582364 RepID=UPI001944C585|nr:hypothetical protein [Demequina activiva]
MSDSTSRGAADAPPQPDAGWTPPSAHDSPTAQGWSAPATPPPPGPGGQGTPASHPHAPPAPAPTYRSWQPGIIPLRPLTFGDFLAVPFKAMRFNRAVVLGGPLLFALVAGLISVTATWLLFTDPQLGLLDSTPSVSGINGQTVAMLVLALVATLLADVLSSSIVAPGVARAVLGERIGLGTAWTQMRRRLGSLLVLYIASTVVYVALIVVVALPLLLGLAAGDSTGATIVLTVLLAFVLLLPAGLVVTILQGIARAMVVLEGLGAIAAIKRTVRLLKGRFWWTVLIVFVTALLINVVVGVLQQAGQIASLAALFVAPDNMAVLAVTYFVAYGITFLVSSVLLYSYMGSVFALLYTDMRMRHEGFDLDLARAAEARAAAAAGR